MFQFKRKSLFSKSFVLAMIAAAAFAAGASAEPTTTELQQQIDKTNSRIDSVKKQYETAIKTGDDAVRDAFARADTQLDNRITNVKNTLSEAFTRADAQLDNRITNVKNALSQEAANGDNAVRAEMESLNTQTNNRIDSVKEQYKAEIAAGDDAVRAELERTNTQTNNRIDSVKVQYQEAIEASDQAVREAFARADTQLNNRITNVRDTLRSEYSGELSTLQDVLGSGYSNPNFSSLRVGNISSDGTNINMGGGRITGLSDGGVYRGSTDAVTGNQLWNAYQRMDDLKEDINIVGAHAAALSGLHPIDYNPFEPTTLSAAIGTYRDEYAVAVGVFHYMRENVLFNLGASICSDGDLMGRAGISFTVGRSGKKPEAPKNMNEMQAQLAQMQLAFEEMKAENERTISELKAENERAASEIQVLKLKLEEK